MRRALVTGDTGFVGRHIRRALESDGWFVVGCDITKGHDCRTLFNADHHLVYDLVIHCAAVVGGRTVISDDPLAITVDLAIDSDMFRWAVRTRQRRIVYFSSSAAYPNRLQTEPGRRLSEHHIDLHQDAPLIGMPDMSYGWTKLTGELLAGYAATAGIPVHVFRPFSGYGHDQDLAYPFPAYIERAIRHSPTFHVWGDGTQTRDFVHIDDIVSAALAAVDQDVRGPVNIGTGRATSFDELAHLVCAPLGYQPDIVHDLSKPSGPSHRVADITRMSEFYKPKITLEEGISRTHRMMHAA